MEAYLCRELGIAGAIMAVAYRRSSSVYYTDNKAHDMVIASWSLHQKSVISSSPASSVTRCLVHFALISIGINGSLGQWVTGSVALQIRPFGGSKQSALFLKLIFFKLTLNFDLHRNAKFKVMP